MNNVHSIDLFILADISRHRDGDEITNNQLAALYGVRDNRPIRESIERLRKAGHPLAYNSKGHFRATCPADFEYMIRDMEKKAASIAVMKNFIKRTSRKLGKPVQLALFEEAS